MQLLFFLLTHVHFPCHLDPLFCALLLATAAITRHVRTRRVPAGPQPTFAQHLIAAANDQDSLTPDNRRHVNETDAAATMPWDSGLKPISRNIRTQSISTKRP
jgi:hypothetical protein